MIDILAIFSAFDIKLNEKYLEFLKDKALREFPKKDIFGVFVTIVRSQILEKWPKDIHGCLGYWTPNYYPMPKKDILQKILELSHNTHYNDRRGSYFPLSLSQDAGAKIEISLMMSPIFPVNIETGMVLDGIFDNRELGLIVEVGGKRATYLPGVFENMGWNEMKRLLVGKAGGKGVAKFFAYRVEKIIVPIYETLFSEECQNILEFPIAEFYREKYKNFIPYEFTNEKVFIDVEQNVRNLSCIGDVIKFSKKYNFSKLLPTIKKNLDFYYQKFINNPGEMRQASAFMLEDYFLLGGFEERVKKITEYLYANLDGMEPRFELGEVLMVLAQVSAREKEFEKQAKKMYARLEGMSVKLDDVFELNWQSQFLEKSNIKNKKLHAAKIWEILQKILTKVSNNIETNYLAVIYECLSSLGKILSEEGIRDDRFEYFIKLNSRRGEWGLYYFRGMQTARLDITGHVIFN